MGKYKIRSISQIKEGDFIFCQNSEDESFLVDEQIGFWFYSDEWHFECPLCGGSHHVIDVYIKI